MQDTFAISGLRRKRAELAGQVAVAERHYLKLSTDLKALDTTLSLFDEVNDPKLIRAVIPRQKHTMFRHGHLIKAVRATLRQAQAPMTVHDIAMVVAGGRGLDVGDAAAARKVVGAVRDTLKRTKKGFVIEWRDGVPYWGLED